MNKGFEAYYKIVEKFDNLSRLIKCAGCDLCDRDFVPLLPFELPYFRRLGVPLKEIDGIYYIGKKGRHSLCVFRDEKSKKCSIYSTRPLVCRMFPLEITSINNKLEWVVYDYCPFVKKTINDPHQNIHEKLWFLVTEIESLFTKEILAFFFKEDTVTRRMESIATTYTSKHTILKEVMNVNLPSAYEIFANWDNITSESIALKKFLKSTSSITAL